MSLREYIEKEILPRYENYDSAHRLDHIGAVIRRSADLAKGYDVDLKQLQEEIGARDKADSEREISPLVQAEDAELLDTSHMTIGEVVQAILDRCR
jgi:cytidylate kinase